VRYADGTPISTSCGIKESDKIRLRCVYVARQQRLFIVGTKDEAEAVLPADQGKERKELIDELIDDRRRLSDDATPIQKREH
jgi:hypothetical protein